jgi:predicted amidophosphoribosyltransferase
MADPAIVLTGPPIKLVGQYFSGWAIDRHTMTRPLPEDRSVKTRSPAGELFYDYRYKGVTRNLSSIVELISHFVGTLFQKDLKFERLIVVPPPVSRPEYRRVIELSAALCRSLKIPSAQGVLARNEIIDEEQAEKSGLFAFQSEQSGRLVEGKIVLVVDDIYRTGKSLESFCRMLKCEANARELHVVAGTRT